MASLPARPNLVTPLRLPVSHMGTSSKTSQLPISCIGFLTAIGFPKFKVVEIKSDEKDVIMLLVATMCFLISMHCYGNIAQLEL